MEGYAVGGLAASVPLAVLEGAGDAVAPGLGQVMVQVAGLFTAAAGSETLAEMEQAAVEASRAIGLRARNCFGARATAVNVTVWARAAAASDRT